MDTDKSSTLAWLYSLLLCGERDMPINLVIRRRFFTKGSASCVHIGYIKEESGERKSVAMVACNPQRNSFYFLFKTRATGFKEPFSFLRFESEEDLRIFLLLLCMVLHTKTSETEFEGCIIDHPSMTLYGPDNRKTIMASVFVLSRFAL